MVPKTKRLLLYHLQEQQPGWCIRTVDSEKCVYRAIGPYGVEISGGSRQPARFHIYVWKKDPTFSVIERHTDLDPRRTDIVALATEIADRYVQRAVTEGAYILPLAPPPSEDEQEIPF
ncbi:MAG: hypothetical protein IKH30_19320 [Clostridia bacterium]|nr:hypothetical protein [Clostridia bacterium]MBR4538503.1 hypothetical protein [Clostridia bacterium]